MLDAKFGAQDMFLTKLTDILFINLPGKILVKKWKSKFDGGVLKI